MMVLLSAPSGPWFLLHFGGPLEVTSEKFKFEISLLKVIRGTLLNRSAYLQLTACFLDDNLRYS